MSFLLSHVLNQKIVVEQFFVSKLSGSWNFFVECVARPFRLCFYCLIINYLFTNRVLKGRITQKSSKNQFSGFKWKIGVPAKVVKGISWLLQSGLKHSMSIT